MMAFQFSIQYVLPYFKKNQQFHAVCFVGLGGVQEQNRSDKINPTLGANQKNFEKCWMFLIG